MVKNLLSVLAVAAVATFSTTATAQTKFYEPDQVYSSLSEIGDNDFAIVNMTEGKVVLGRDAQNVAFDTYANLFKSDVAVLSYKLEAVDGGYLLKCVTPAGGDYGLWGSNPCYLNGQPNIGGVTFNLGLADRNGQDGENCAVWDIQKVDAGFILKNVGNGGYFNGTNVSAEPSVWQLCSYKEVEKVNPIPEPDRTATDAVELQITSGNKNENGQYQGPVTLSWTDGIDLSQYRYLTITLGQNTDGGNVGPVSLTDGEVRVTGDDYGEANFNMWFGQWNHHITCKIDLEKLRINKFLNIYDLKELTINCGDAVVINNIYASNEDPKTKAFWAGFEGNEGTYQRVNLTEGAYGTICLPYQAAYAGVNVYSIAGMENGYVNLTQVEGLLEAGSAYIYCVNPSIAEGKALGAYFYKASAAEVGDPTPSNGLVGTFVDTTAPMDCLVLSSNTLYNVNSTVNVAANKAWINPGLIENTSSASARLAIEDATAIKNVQNALNSGKIYDMNGREVKSMQKGGIYVVGGMKVCVK